MHKKTEIALKCSIPPLNPYPFIPAFRPWEIMEALFQINSQLVRLLPSSVQALVKTLPFPHLNLLLVLFLLLALVCAVLLGKKPSSADLKGEDRERAKQAKLREFREKRKLEKAMKRREAEEAEKGAVERVGLRQDKSPSPNPLPKPVQLQEPAASPIQSVPIRPVEPPSEMVSKPAPKEKKNKKPAPASKPTQEKPPVEERKAEETVPVKGKAVEVSPVVAEEGEFQEAKGKKKPGKGKKPVVPKAEAAGSEPVPGKAVEVAEDWQQQVSRKAKRAARK